MAVVRIKTGHTTKRDRRCGIALFLIIVLFTALGYGAVGPLLYRRQADQLDLSPGSIGSPAGGSGVPVVSTLAEMERCERFVLRNEEYGDWQRSSGGMIGDVYYSKVTLPDGAVLAAKIHFEAQKSEYLPEGEGTPAGEHVLVTYPVGALRPWPEGVDPRQAGWVTYLDGWLDMEGDFGAELPDQGAVCQKAMLIMAAAGLVVGLIATVGISLRGDRKDRLAATPQNDLERWILGTYAIWAQFFGQLDYRGKLMNPNTPQSPLYFGGRPRDDDSKKLTRRTLASSWEIKSLRELLEAVDYMSQGPGLRDCRTQEDRAWELCRSSQLLGMGYIAGWLSREEMVSRSCAVGRVMQETFHSWDELCRSYLDAYEAWSLQGGSSSSAAAMRRNIHNNLCQRPDSPYRLPWLLQLDPSAWARRAQVERDIAR